MPPTQKRELSQLVLTQCIHRACVLEAAAHKAGNVHPDAGFADLAFNDFLVSAAIASPILAGTPKLGVGSAIYEALSGTHAMVGRNTNLGIVLLIAPLAAVPSGVSLQNGIAEILNQLTVEDASQVYRAIRLVNPGGMGQSDSNDISDDPQDTLLEVMKQAVDRDLVARQYARDFDIVLDVGLPFLVSEPDFVNHWQDAIIALQLELMAQFPDTLIARKCGASVAAESADRARQVLNAGGVGTPQGLSKYLELDGWLREDGNSRNPGTTADLIAASLFAGFREGVLEMPQVTLS